MTDLILSFAQCLDFSGGLIEHVKAQRPQT